jgi:hypothetical protein
MLYACFRGRNIYRNMIKKLKARIEWGQVWLKIREDKPMSACLNPNLPIHEAFNTLAPSQMQNMQTCKPKRAYYVCKAYK